ncbi:MAG: GNAT family N-acetyltransferase [Burkholderiales bacterium]|jgi:putative acetyltransferase|nr:GNAT family N-acetyltransferase [Burkholderiales bacterium]
MSLRIGLERADLPEVVALIDELDAYQKPLYPPESHHGIDIEALVAPHVLFAVARDANGAAVGCGAIVLEAEYGEVKRMYVPPAQRGRGIAEALLRFLEAEAMQRGCTLFALETGIHQHAALAFYARMGYRRCDPFGDYRPDPLSVFMRKAAGAAAA